MDKRETEHEFGEMLLIEVAWSIDLQLAMQLLRNLELSESTLTMEELLIKLEENQRSMERLTVASPAKSKSGERRAGINPWRIQQFSNNLRARHAEVNMILHSALKRKHAA